MLCLWLFGYLMGGGNRGSRARRKLFSSIVGITLLSTLHDTSRQGLVFISISQGLKSSSSIKSRPKTSKLNCFF